MDSTTADMIISAASSLQGQGSGGPVALADRVPLDVLTRRLAHRRHSLAMQVASYALGATVLLIYVHAGTIPTLLPTAFLLCGITLIGIFALLSETHVNDRFEDHYLTVFQVGGHVAIQLGFLLAAPQIGYAFLNVLFLVFGVAALQDRRCIMRMLDDEIARAQRSNTPCTIALIDLDWFKRVNDAYGHPTGDEVLRTFAITVFANIRHIDKFGRYGGEEFLLVLPDTPDGEAVRTLDRLRAIIADLDWSAFSPGMQVTISAGVATLKPDETPDTFLARADRALYAAKAQGRNRIARA